MHPARRKPWAPTRNPHSFHRVQTNAHGRGTRRTGVGAPYEWGSPLNRRPGGGVEPRPYMQSKRRRRFTASRETAGGDGVLFLHRRRQSIFLIDAALRAAASLFSIVTQDGQRRIFQRSQPTAPKRRIGLPRSVGEAGGALPVRWVHTPNKSRFSLGRHSRFFWQGQKKWGGIFPPQAGTVFCLLPRGCKYCIIDCLSVCENTMFLVYIRRGHNT